MTVDELFVRLDKRRTEILDLVITSQKRISINSLPVDLFFENQKELELANPWLSGLGRKSEDKADITISLWQESPKTILSMPGKTGRDIWYFKGNEKVAVMQEEEGLVAADFERKRFYVCVSNETGMAETFYGHLFTLAFMMILRMYGQYIVHGAAIGCNGSGALLVARGGKGKSTLSVSCLMGDFAFVADDYTIICRENGELIALPLFKTVGLNQDMYGVLNPDMPIVRTDKNRNDKLLLDASQYSYADKLRIKYMIIPRVAKGQRPCIEAVNPGKGIIPFVHSTVNQLMLPNDTELVRTLTSMVSGLPVFEFILGSDIIENREYLRKWLSEQNNN